jgi:hypothetical protein
VPNISFRRSLEGVLRRGRTAQTDPFLPQHDIRTVVSMKLGGIKNGALLDLIEREGFDVFLTGDKNMENQQRLDGRPFAVLIMSAINWPVVKPHIYRIANAIDEAQAGTVMTINCGVFTARSKPGSG